MELNQTIKNILDHYESDSPGVKTNLSRILLQGKLGGTGRLLILPVDQGFEHGPGRSFAVNEDAYDPYYHYKLAIEAGLSAYAAPFGMLAAGASNFAGYIPTILKLNSSNSLVPRDNIPNQAITATVKDALHLGCSAIGLTIYPGSGAAFDMIEEAKELIAEAKSYGLATVVWSYPRGGDLSKEGETAIDVCAYAAHIAALIGAHIIKVKPPTAYIEQIEAKKIYENMDLNSLQNRIKHIKQACFNGKRLVVFSGGVNKNVDDLYKEIQEIYHGGGSGSIIGRNSFQRSRKDALEMLNKIIEIYRGNNS
ncbi:Fructose-bisphosphate aldolase class 1 [Rickettsiales bacterium Ac37b]|nr:Fructose-bisphosphate aldolase class 1 [Rickettsiales bacterium Ac37b]